MKKLFIILGILFVIIVILIATGITYFAFAGKGLDKESRMCVNKIMNTVVKDWSEEEFVKLAASELIQKTSKGNLKMIFGRFRTLGELIKYAEPVGEAKMSIIFGGEKNVTAHYNIKTEFENASAVINITLKKINNNWKITGFHINSIYFD